MNIKPNPLIETYIKRACFINGNLTIFPNDNDLKFPDNMKEVVEYLFGEGAYVIEDCVNGHHCIILKNASFLVNDSLTTDADYIMTQKDPYAITS